MKKIILIFIMIMLLLPKITVSAEISGDFEYATKGDGIAITKYIGKQDIIVIPDNLEGKPVMIIGDLGDCVFGENAVSITVPSSVTKIGSVAFSSCAELKSIIVDSNNLNFSSDEQNILYNKNKTRLLKCPRGKRGCVKIPNDVINIGDGAFYGCENIISINIPDSVTDIERYAFQDCVGLTSVTIPSSVISLGDYAFGNCKNLSTIILNNPYTLIETFIHGRGSYPDFIPLYSTPFSGCQNLTEIYGYPGSTAEEFANEQGYTFIPIIKVLLNGGELVFDAPPHTVNDRVMLPMRKIFESLGAEVIWDEDTQTVTAQKDGTVIIMQIDNPQMTVNGQPIPLDAAPCFMYDRTLVPVRAISEALGMKINWNGDENTVEITK